MKQQIQTHNKPNQFVKWIKGLSSYTKNKTINAVLFFLAFFIIGGTNYYLMFKKFVPTFFILDFLIICICVSLIFLFKKTMFDRIYLPILLVVITGFYALNDCYYNYFGCIVSFKDIPVLLANINQVAYHSASIQMWIIIPNIVLYIVFALGIILFNAKWRFKESQLELKLSRKRKVALGLGVLFGSVFLYEFSLQMWISSEEKKGNIDVNYVNFNPTAHFSNLGMITYYLQESRQLMLDKGESVQNIKEFLNNAKFLNDDYTNWFTKNGLENPNIVVIMIETGDYCMLNEYTTPRLWELVHDGLHCNRNYSFNRTNISDVMGITGSYPEFTIDSNSSFAMPFNLPQTLGDDYQKYFTTDLASIEINDGYNSKELMPKFGFDGGWYHDDMIPDIPPWRSAWNYYTQDSFFMKAIRDKILTLDQAKPFYIHYLTIEMHMNQQLTPQNKFMFDDLEERFANDLATYEQQGKWVNPFPKGTEDYNRFRRYTLKTMDFDEGLGMIMDVLYHTEGRDDLKNTLLVTLGDHSWYERCQDGYTFAQRIKGIRNNDIRDIRQYSTVMGFYHPQLNEKFEEDFSNHELNKPTWPSVVVPTILDLLGATYNPWLYKNKSIFDPTYDDNEIFYTNLMYYYMNEHYTSDDGHNITQIYDDNGHKYDFVKKLQFIAKQTRVIDTIYRWGIFEHYNYEEFMPKE
ncbi:MAG: hypothetical protein ACOQNV_02440 [Mycoplasmoidaceae bacterium]